MNILASLIMCFAVVGTELPVIELPQPETATIYDIPLSAELQEYTYWLCKEKNVDYEMLLAVMKTESNFKPDLISKTNDYGLMQINKVNHKWLSEQVGITDFLDPKQSILCGATMLGNLRKKYDEPHKILMAYNMGEGGARNLWQQNVYTSSYSRKVMKTREELGGK